MIVFFYDDEEIFSQKILRGLEKIDDELHSAQGNTITKNYGNGLLMYYTTEVLMIKLWQNNFCITFSL